MGIKPRLSDEGEMLMKRKQIKRLVIVLGLILILLIGGRAALSGIQNNLNTLSRMNPAMPDLSQVKDGVYLGDYSTFPVSAQVEVTVADHVITDIRLLKHTNGQGESAETILPVVLQAQSIQVDIITGATYSSKVILKAIELSLLSSLR